MDIATLAGILAGFGMALGALFLSQAPETLVAIPSLMFVLGGTCATTLLTFSIKEVWQAIRSGIRAFAVKDIPARDAVAAVVHLAAISRKEGIMALEKIQTPNPVLKKAAQLIAHNADPVLIRDTLNIEILSLRRHRGIGISVFSRLALYAPAMGMIGTLIWLAQMLTDLKTPDPLGPDMVVAMMASLYGCLLSTLLFLPIAGKLKTRSRQDEYRLHIIFEGACCILENNNPKLVYEKLSSFLTSKERAGAR